LLRNMPYKHRQLADAMLTGDLPSEIATRLGYPSIDAFNSTWRLVRRKLGVGSRHDFMAREIQRLKAQQIACVKCGKGLTA
jgi:DNA-binding CsgD family transcriptional regulator